MGLTPDRIRVSTQCLLARQWHHGGRRTDRRKYTRQAPRRGQAERNYPSQAITDLDVLAPDARLLRATGLLSANCRTHDPHPWKRKLCQVAGKTLLAHPSVLGVEVRRPPLADDRASRANPSICGHGSVARCAFAQDDAGMNSAETPASCATLVFKATGVQ